MKRAILATLSMATFGNANAGFYTGNDLYRMLNGTGAERSVALGYVAAMSDSQDHSQLLTVISMTVNKTWKDKFPYQFFCVPANVTSGQLADIVKKYLAENPASRHADAAALVSAALIAVWPCQANPY